MRAYLEFSDFRDISVIHFFPEPKEYKKYSLYFGVRYQTKTANKIKINFRTVFLFNAQIVHTPKTMSLVSLKKGLF